jgi:hypothetical protein
VSDYLWDKSGDPDPEIARLEKTLGQLRYQPKPPRWVAPTVIALLAAAAVALLFLFSRKQPTWEVARVNGAPSIHGRAFTTTAQLAVGKWLETDDVSSARIKVATIGTIDVKPRTRVQLVETHKDRHRIALDRGAIEVFVNAPPRVFVVDAASISAIDLGCAYTMSIDEASREITLHVTSGQVSLERSGRATVVRRGMSAITRGETIGTPFSDRSTPELRAALHKFDFAGGSAVDVVNASTPPDAQTLFFLLERVPNEVRPAVYARLAELSPPPPTVDPKDLGEHVPAALSAWKSDIEAKW